MNKGSMLLFQIVDLDTKRNRNREALNALKNEVSDSGERPFVTGCCQREEKVEYC